MGPEWNESFDEWVKRYWGKYPPIDEDEIEAIWKKWKRRMKEEKEKEENEVKEEKNESTDLTSTLGSSRNPTDPKVTTEPIKVNRCQRPLQRARERRDARERDAHAVINSDPHDPGSLGSRVSRDLEQDRSQLKCDRCNNSLTDLDWSKIKSNG